MKTVTDLNYYPLDRLALVVSRKGHLIQELVLLSSRWGVYTYKDSKWSMTVPNHFRYKENLYAHLDSSKYHEILTKFKSLSVGSTLSDLTEFQITYDFEDHVFYDCLFPQNLRDAYEIARWVNEFTLPSFEELEPASYRGADEYFHYVREVEELEEARVEYEELILSRRRKSEDEKRKEPLLWIEGLPPVNRYFQDLFQVAYDRNFMHEIGSGYESDWDIDARVSNYHSYISGNKRLSIEELESIAEFLKVNIYQGMSPLSAESISYIAEVDQENSEAKFRQSFEESFLGTTGHIPEFVAGEFLRSGLDPQHLAEAIAQTKITSIRILYTLEPGVLTVFHLVCPFEAFDSLSEQCDTEIATFAQWETIETDFGDASYRISMVFQDAIGMDVHRKAMFICNECGEQLEDCENVFDDRSETWEVVKAESTQTAWWPEWWKDFNGPRLMMDGHHTVATELFVSEISGAIASSLNHSSFESMTEDSELLVWQLVGYLWNEVARAVENGFTDK